MRIEEGFQPAVHSVGEPYSQDYALQSLLKRLLPSDIHEEVTKDLKRFSKDLAGPISHLATLADHNELPRLVQYDNLGRRIDRLETSEGWRALKAVAFEEGLVSIFHTRPVGRHSRLYGFAKTYLWTPFSRVVGCPLSMADGACRVLTLAGTPEQKDQWLPKLLSRDPAVAVTAGQFMTERAGGSDVSVTETKARPVFESSDPSKSGSTWELDGFKWFSSASDGAFSLALARTSKRQLSLFLVPLSLQNGVRLHRLKRKIGTHALPTAELEFNDSRGQLIGQLGDGVRQITPVLNITRVHSAINSVAGLNRGLQTARAFARVRVVRDKLLAENPLHTAWMADLEVQRRAILHLVMNIANLLGATETDVATKEETMLVRLLTPAAKAFCAHVATKGLLECIEAMGGQGYMEEEGIGRMLRDGAVENVWEGTKTVLALDVARVLFSPKGPAIDDFIKWVKTTFDESTSGIEVDRSLVDATLDLLPRLTINDQPTLLRQLLDLVAFLGCATFLAEHAAWSQAEDDAFVLQRWLISPLWHGTAEQVKAVLGGARNTAVESRVVYGKL